MTNTRVLVADDHGIMRDSIRALLSSREGLEVVGEAADGKEAVSKAIELHPDVVVMDIGMPVMDGLEAARRIKKRNPAVKVLVLAEQESKDYVLSAVKAGVDGYIPKRAAASELVTAIGTLRRDDSFLHPSAATLLVQDYRAQSKEREAHRALTTRQREVLKLATDGHTSREIAGMLSISLKTVLGHRNRLMGKLALHNWADMVKYAIHQGLTNVDN